MKIKSYLSIGAANDGTKSTINCKAESNYIMTPINGVYTNASNSLLFSKCSKAPFKSKLLSVDKTYDKRILSFEIL